MFGWSKYGGARKGLYKENLDEWWCQICSSHHTGAAPSYFIPEDEYQREYMRICSICKATSRKMGFTTYDAMVPYKDKIRSIVTKLQTH